MCYGLDFDEDFDEYKVNEVRKVEVVVVIQQSLKFSVFVMGGYLFSTSTFYFLCKLV